MKKERYFFFSFSYTSEIANGFGSLTFTCKGMPTKKNITATCENSISDKYPELKSLQVVILAWNELKKSDYEYFNNN